MKTATALWETLEEHKAALTTPVDGAISPAQAAAVLALRTALRDHTPAVIDAVRVKDGVADKGGIRQFLENQYQALGLDIDAEEFQVHALATERSIVESQEHRVEAHGQYHAPDHFIEADIDAGALSYLYKDRLSPRQLATTLATVASHDVYHLGLSSKAMMEKSAADIADAARELQYTEEQIPLPLIEDALESGSPAEFISAHKFREHYEIALQSLGKTFDNFPGLEDEIQAGQQAIMLTNISDPNNKAARNGTFGNGDSKNPALSLMIAIAGNADLLHSVIGVKEGIAGSGKLVTEGDQAVVDPVKAAVEAFRKSGETSDLYDPLILTSKGLPQAYQNFLNYVVRDEETVAGLPILQLCTEVTQQELSAAMNVTADKAALQFEDLFHATVSQHEILAARQDILEGYLALANAEVMNS